MYAEVIVDIAHSDVDRIFEYSCTEGVQPGCRVKVPFGNRLIDGFVMNVKDTCEIDPAKVKPIAEVFDEAPALVPECVWLTGRISARYHVPKAAALRLFLPAEMRKGKVRELYRKYASLSGQPFVLSRTAQKQAEIVAYLREKGEAEYTPLCETYGRAAVNALEKKGAIQVEKKRITRQPAKEVTGIDNIHELTPAQRMAIKSIDTTDKMVTLLHGVTGSGKTEIYLQIIGQEIEKGRTAIFLVPEISLTPQMLSQLRARFKGQAAILHSGLSAGERFDEWWRLRSGEAKIAIGARSAIFAPLENVGVIIIDEEHDSSYVSETAPRYSTISIALLRAKYNHAKIILGSATPSVETYIEGKEGRFNLITLTDRINKKPMPEIIMADMRREVKRGNNSAFSQALRDELQATLDSGNQAIIFLNRRGYAQTVLCRDCGYVAKCEDCDVSLTYHADTNRLLCHCCGRSYRMLDECPECHGKHIRYNGTGTQRVVEDLEKLFPQARLIRMDNDTVSGKDGHYKILQKFAAHEADILVGTQMIAKGHDFPSVTLVGIMDADQSLQFSDYRSGERTFQLITQVAGRSGRAGARGKVVLQTYNPSNYILRYATQYDYAGFFENEVNIRKATLFPPFAVIVRIMVTSESQEHALAAAKEVNAKITELKSAHEENFLFARALWAPVKRMEKKFRLQILMRMYNSSLLPQIYEICAAANGGDVLAYVEENPANLN